jgi:hypothetical protein
MRTAVQGFLNVEKIAPGLAAHSPINVQIEDCNGYDLELDVVVEVPSGDRTGRFVCESLQVKQRNGGPPVTSEGIRGIPVATLTKAAGARHILETQVSGSGDTRLTKISPLTFTPEQLEQLRQDGPVDTTLQRVSVLYRLALVMGEPPTRAVERTFNLPRSTAGRWVSLARDRGFLSRAEAPGKAGG